MAQAKPTAGRLVIGSKRYSSWSLRGWLAVRFAGLEVEELVIPLAGGATPAVKAATPSGTVPFLEHEGARVWESLAICEYCAERAPDLWPADRPLAWTCRHPAHGAVALETTLLDLRSPRGVTLVAFVPADARAAATLASLAADAATP